MSNTNWLEIVTGLTSEQIEELKQGETYKLLQEIVQKHGGLKSKAIDEIYNRFDAKFKFEH